MQKGFDYIGVGVTFTCHDGQGNVLFARRGAGARDENGKWELPGGTLEWGEMAEVGVLRELKEEFCVEPKEWKFIGYHNLMRNMNGRDSHWLVLDFLMHVDPEKVKIGEPDKCDAIAWRHPDDMPQPIHPGVLLMIDNVRKHLP